MANRIVGGTLTFNKKFFAKESLKAGSFVRKVIGLEFEGSRKVQTIVKEGNNVKIIYKQDDQVFVPDDFTTFFDEMKAEYTDEVKGKIVVAMLFELFEDMRINIDL